MFSIHQTCNINGENMSSILYWDNLYRENKHLSIWPWSNLVSLCLRFSPLRLADDEFSVLEVGCGAGANIPFFLSYTNNYYGIDGSEHIISKLKDTFAPVKKNFIVGDFTEALPFENQFDLVVDRAASTHNNTQSIRNYLSLAHSKLKTGGLLIILDWFSTQHSGFNEGKACSVDYVRSDYFTGPFANVGVVHFFDKPLITELTKDFELLHLEHTQVEIEGNDSVSASWSLVLKKNS